MSCLLVLLTACAFPCQAPDENDGPRPRSTMVKAGEYEKEYDRLQKRFLKISEDAEYLEAQVAKKKAEAESAKADLTIYRLTHDIEPARDEVAPARLDDGRPAPAYAAPDFDRLVELPTEKEKQKANVETLRGRVVDTTGKAIVGATIRVEDINNAEKPLRVQTDAGGDYSFTLSSESPNFGLTQIFFEAPGFARRVVTPNDHGTSERRLVKLEPGVSLKGSIVHQGRKIPKVKVYLVPTERTYPGYLGDWSAITDEQGEFAFTSLPAEMDAELFFDIDSLKHLGAISFQKVRTTSITNAGSLMDPIEVGPAHKVAGQVIFRDGKKVPAGSTLGISVGGWSSQSVKLDAEGRFEVTGMPSGQASLSVVFPNREYAPKGYRLSAENVSLDHSSPWCLTGMLNRDITDLKILFEPGLNYASPGSRETNESIPTDQADLATEPLTGLPATRPNR